MFWYCIRPRRMRRLSHRVVTVIFICATVILLWLTSTPVSGRKSAAWTVAAEILDTLDTAVGDYVRSAVNLSVQAEESFSTRLLERRDAAAQELLQCFSGLSQFGSCSLSHSAVDTTSAPPVVPSIIPLPDDTQIHNISCSRNKPISCLCSSLAGKRLTMVGGDHVYRFHNLLLDHQKKSEGKRFPCLGKEFCTHHHLCLRATRNNPVLKEEPMRYISSPSVEELVQTSSSLVNYVLSDTLLTFPDPEAPEYSVPYIHAFSGVRSRETYWLTSAKKADVLLLGRGSFSAPPSTYTGNWSLLLDFPSHTGSYHAKIPSFAASIPNPLQIVDAAVHATLSVFLPEIKQMLSALHVNGCLNRKKKVIWLISQPRFPGNGRGHKSLFLRTYFLPNGQDEPSPGDLKAVLLRHIVQSTNGRLDDPWTLYHNVQVYLQDRLLRQILPRFGIHLLQLDSFVEAGPNVAGFQLQYRGSHT
ncbi:uncharacterized protein BJ212DRAFT_1348406 [Suillus subaureus]|uniref:Uncharacterized protein n=1 Tax=Suillus subaureus TaxID=48587 RepID=A0A9P7EDU7_9AGAM|nr:uncharacterized protein BJ212DRAFT_1348406 [Suillus subaureus]KAG1818030.1 hypothetical protein BJ212DRAFT_1348406 [Suillus subaureus]